MCTYLVVDIRLVVRSVRIAVVESFPPVGGINTYLAHWLADKHAAVDSLAGDRTPGDVVVWLVGSGIAN